MSTHSPTQIAEELAYLRTLFVNVYFVGAPGGGDRSWTLVDTGVPGTARQIIAAAEARFGEGARPNAILLTHGHFDHIGGVRELAERWDAPVYAHRMEFPYLTGRSPYPPPDPTVGGGAVARLSPLFSRGPIDIKSRLQPLPDDGSVPGLPGWRWFATPGHAPGHVSFFREADAVLIAGDAFVTTAQESSMAVMTQRVEMHGPPMYFTPDWDRARMSVQTLAELRPSVAATGHGRPMEGPEMLTQLERLARRFDQEARPKHGRYVSRPARTDENGLLDVPPPVSDPFPKMALGAAAAVLFGTALVRHRRRAKI